MSLEFSCTQCSARYGWSPALVGRTYRCPACQAPIEVGDPTAAPPPLPRARILREPPKEVVAAEEFPLYGPRALAVLGRCIIALTICVAALVGIVKLIRTGPPPRTTPNGDGVNDIGGYVNPEQSPVEPVKPTDLDDILGPRNGRQPAP